MSETEFTPDAVRAALRDAERHIRLNWWVIMVLAALQALILGRALKVADFSNPTHLLIVLGAAFIWMQMMFLLEMLKTRQDAMNARILRALELLDQRLAGR